MLGLPATIDPVQLADRGAHLDGRLPLKAMPRLARACLEDAGEVLVDLHFERSEDGSVRRMYGNLRAALRVTCQRCLEAMELEVQTAPHLLLFRPGERDDLLEQEPDSLVVDKPLSLAEIVEDELLLAMPMIPMHAPDRCPAVTSGLMRGGSGTDRHEGTPDKSGPFAVLGRLKRSDD